jgi:hypothetical protein
MSEGEGIQRLKPRVEEVLLWLDTQFVERCRERNAVPVLMCIPHPSNIEADVQERKRLTMEIAARAGMTVIDMTKAYDSVDKKSLWITSWDSHPNAQGHRLLAESFYESIKTQLNI